MHGVLHRLASYNIILEKCDLLYSVSYLPAYSLSGLSA